VTGSRQLRFTRRAPFERRWCDGRARLIPSSNGIIQRTRAFLAQLCSPLTEKDLAAVFFKRQKASAAASHARAVSGLVCPRPAILNEASALIELRLSGSVAHGDHTVFVSRGEKQRCCNRDGAGPGRLASHRWPIRRLITGGPPLRKGPLLGRAGAALQRAASRTGCTCCALPNIGILYIASRRVWQRCAQLLSGDSRAEALAIQP